VSVFHVYNFILNTYVCQIQNCMRYTRRPKRERPAGGRAVALCGSTRKKCVPLPENSQAGARFFGGPLLPSGSVSALKRVPMTATAILFTSDGFAVAADGRQRWGHSPTRDSVTIADERENEQKIFEIPGAAIAYTVRGHAASRDRAFNVSALVQSRSAGLLHKSRYSNLLAFVNALSLTLEQAIERAKHDGVIEDYPLAEVTFVGYIGRPGWIDVRFRPSFRGGMVREVVPRDFHSGYWLYTGSPVIAQLMVSRDTRVPDVYSLLSETMSLDDATTIARAYIETCCSPLGMQVDAENCARIGGHVHVATVRPIPRMGILWERWRRPLSSTTKAPDGGFQWVIPPSG